jgi:hypothetical protein
MPAALGWLKFHCYSEVPEQDELLSFLSIYGYRLAICYFGWSEMWGRQLSEISWWVSGLESGTHSLDILTRCRLHLLGQPLRRWCWPDSSWGLCRRPGYVENVKLVWRWVIWNSLFSFCIWHSRHMPSIIYDASSSSSSSSSFIYIPWIRTGLHVHMDMETVTSLSHYKSVQ